MLIYWDYLLSLLILNYYFLINLFDSSHVTIYLGWSIMKETASKWRTNCITRLFVVNGNEKAEAESDHKQQYNTQHAPHLSMMNWCYIFASCLWLCQSESAAKPLMSFFCYFDLTWFHSIPMCMPVVSSNYSHICNFSLYIWIIIIIYSYRSYKHNHKFVRVNINVLLAKKYRLL